MKALSKNGNVILLLNKRQDALQFTQVLLNGLADTWPARKLWTIEQLLLNHGDTTFRISQRSSGKILMNLKDYASYMSSQHDEDPLYIFDDKVVMTCVISLIASLIQLLNNLLNYHLCSLVKLILAY